MRFLFDSRKVGIGICFLGLVALLLIANPAQAINRFWDGGGLSNSLGELENWDELEAELPDSGDDANFDDTGSIKLTPDTAGFDYQYRYLKFPDTCTVEYTIGSVGNHIKVSKINANHVGITQTIDCEIICTTSYNLRTAGSIVMDTFSTDDAGVEFTETENHVDSVTTIKHLKAGGGKIYYYSPGTLKLTGDSAGWTDKLSIKGYTTNLEDCVVVVSHSNALGDPTGITDIEGGTQYHGRMELNDLGGADLSIPEQFQLRGRETDVDTVPDNHLSVHIRNVQGDNTLSGNMTLAGSGWNCRIACEAGTLTLAGEITNTNTRDEGRYLFLQGAGDGTMSGPILDGTENLIIHLVKEGIGTWTVTGAGHTYTGYTNVSEGTLALGAAADISTSAGVVVEAGAEFNVSALAAGFFSLGAGKTLGGSGTVTGDVTAAATSLVDPGATAGGPIGIDTADDQPDPIPGAGTLTVTGDLSMSAGANMKWELAALSEANPGTNFDTVTVSGDLVLGGTSELTLNFDLLDAALRPDAGTPNGFWDSDRTWKIIDADGNPGPTDFSNLVNATYPGVGTFDTDVDVDGDGYDILLKFTASGVLIPGDTDGNLIVDAVDAAVVASHWGAAADPDDYAFGNFNGDSVVDAIDAAIQAAHWGDHTGGESAQGVPEPSTLAGILAGLLSLVWIRRKR